MLKHKQEKQKTFYCLIILKCLSQKCEISMYIEDPLFCVCYTVVVPPILCTVGSGFIYLAIIHEDIISEVLYAIFFASLFILLGLYMFLYTAKEFIHFN